MSDRDISSWDQRLGDQVHRNWNNYTRRRIDLATARNDEMVSLAGEFLYVEEVSSESALATLRLNRNTNDSIDLRRNVILKTIFNRLYLTNTAQAGEWIDLLVGVNFEYQVGSNIERAEIAQGCFFMFNIAALTDTVGPNLPCNSVLLRSNPVNTDYIDVNFGAAALIPTIFRLYPGDWMGVRLDNTNKIHALFAVSLERLFVCYQV